VTSTGAIVTSAYVSLAYTSSDWYMNLNGGGIQVTPDGTWELGLQPNTDVWLQVKVPATATGQVFCGVPNGGNFTLVAASGAYPSQYCDASYKFNIGTTARRNVQLHLPVMGVISGHVTGTDGSTAKASEVCVTAYKSGFDASSWYAQSAGSSCTDESGNYQLGVTFDSNPANNAALVTKYRLQFNSAGNTSPYKSKWYSGSGSTDSYVTASDISITSSSPNATADLVLPIGKTISGRITDTSGNPVAGANVIAMSYANTATGPIGTRGSLSTEDGTFTISGLDPGTYSVKASHPDYGSRWLGGPNSTDAQSFTIQANDVGASNKNISLAPGYSIGGLLGTSDGGSTPVCASAYRVSSNDMTWGEFVQSTCFSAPGGWNIKGLQPGQYKVRFDIRDGDYKSQFFGGTTDFFQADLISVNQSNVVGKDIVFQATKSIVYKLVNEDATAVTNACINAYKIDTGASQNRMWQGMTCANSAGSYKIRGIDPGDYVVQVTTQGTDYRPGYYSINGKLTSSDAASFFNVATSDNVKDLGTTTLYKGPRIDATLNYNSTPVANVCVNAILVVDDYSWGTYSGTSCSGRDGKVSLRGLVEGTYRLQVSPNSEYRGGWINASGAITGNMAAAVKKVIQNTNIDIGGVALTAGAKSTGKVLYDGVGVPMVCVQAIRNDGTDWGTYENSTCTSNNGEFVLTGLDPASSYWFRIYASAGDFKQGYVNGSHRVQTSRTGIPALTNSAEISLGEIQLSTAPSIKGTMVSGTEKSPEANVCISAIDAVTNSWVSSSCTSSSGKFALRGLDAGGTYKLNWWTQNKLLTNGWYKEQVVPSQTSSMSDATVISVPSDGVSGLEIRMRNGAIITGSVPTGICVAAWRYPLSDSANRTNADAIACGNDSGRFELKGLLETLNSSRVDYYLEAFKKDGSATTQVSPSGNDPVHTGDDITVSAS
jgi:protocatechuate 3,4-dioxygenase beta subunit